MMKIPPEYLTSNPDRPPRPTAQRASGEPYRLPLRYSLANAWGWTKALATILFFIITAVFWLRFIIEIVIMRKLPIELQMILSFMGAESSD